MAIYSKNHFLSPELFSSKKQFFEDLASCHGFSGSFSKVEYDPLGLLFIYQGKKIHRLPLTSVQKETANQLLKEEKIYLKRLRPKKYIEITATTPLIEQNLPDRKSRKLLSQCISANMLVSSWMGLGKNFSSLIGHVPGQQEVRSWSYSLNGISEIGYIWNTFNSYSDYLYALRLKDEEGITDAKRRGVRASFQTLGAALGISATALEQRHLPSASYLANLNSMGLFDIASILGLGIATQKLFRSLRFRKKITQYWNHAELPLREKALGVLNFFKENLSLTKEEVKAIRKKYPDPAQQSQELSLFLEKKIARFKRRLGNKSYELLVKNNTLDRLLKEITENPSSEVLGEASHLIEVLLKENAKQSLSYALLWVVSLLGLVTSFTSQFLGAGLAIKMLKFLSSLLSVLYMSYMAFLYFKYRSESGYDFSTIRLRDIGGG